MERVPKVLTAAEKKLIVGETSTLNKEAIAQKASGLLRALSSDHGSVGQSQKFTERIFRPHLKTLKI